MKLLCIHLGVLWKEWTATLTQSSPVLPPASAKSTASTNHGIIQPSQGKGECRFYSAW